uniref:Trafficking protein particle complex subunit n=1 Tax=Grammatophora oceanica TaxID=210454 RepID=A0A7S1VQ48_9STRA|mmetsp:Transcript_51371/g.76726  ORF Transcript_51371/g.76726 Transcript_51371/m.76726 type:complete len:139 (+) Transcript_51371:116-532(+)|eukprot:CAMPEP_0194046376 /NCGR_PEP_ID=MMETSP0009_2-20130614/21065_1 /TAXON_ID=210454 /ORGANISM="Grammatophora oceanica, Strain CCMP 410" /LENGTH=138 /DNA_ID=CAMNT_0038691641 /DNA_START=99 /DNA_END=515 /DNA_ORIENTATION=-
MSSPLLLFVIVGKNEPLYEAEFNKSGSLSSDSATRQNYFVLHSALDLVEKAAWTTTNMYLKVVDKVNQQQVSTFLTAGNIKFMLLHSGRSEDSIRNFFNDVYELYVKLSMNPFYRYDTPITAKSFDTRVRQVARRYLS